MKERVKWPVECLPGEDMGEFTDNSHLLRIFKKNLQAKLKNHHLTFGGNSQAHPIFHPSTSTGSLNQKLHPLIPFNSRFFITVDKSLVVRQRST
jgi:hypothetical protein